jgi:predicted AlkP superfamily phosphohydrolase/phosphomutase/tetratricopeptide (TPR) repeat protein
MPELSRTRVLLIGWDAADWKFINPLLDAGRMPNLSRLVDAGTIGNLGSLKPCLSPILWTSIATGKFADQHGILGFVEPVAGGAGVRLASSTSRKTKALWNMLDQSQRQTIVVNWFASHPAEAIRGGVVSNRFFEPPPVDASQPWPVPPGSVHPAEWSTRLEDLRFHPNEFSVADLQNFIPEWSSIDPRSDGRPNDLMRELAKTISIHSVATTALETLDWDLAAILYDGIDTLGHHFMPYHPPQLPGVSELDFRLYQNVMTQVYLFHDEMLGRLMTLAGDETTIVLLSDHGFHCDHQRPAPLDRPAAEEELAAAWHRPYGVLAVRGPGIRPDERVYGATLLDIAPTILHILGLPIGKDMHGKPLVQIFDPPPPAFQTIDSWDRVGAGRTAPPTPPPDDVSLDAIRQLINLGYLPTSALDDVQAAKLASRETQFNLAIVYASSGRQAEAKRELTALCEREPGHPRYTLALAKTLANLNEHQGCLELLEGLEAQGQTNLDLVLLMAAERFNLGQVEQASQTLAEAHRRYPPHPTLHFLTGNILLQQSQWQAALDAFLQCLELDAEHPHAYHNAAYAANQLNRYEQAAELGLQAVALLFFFPQAHFQMGVAFAGLNDLPRAIRSFDLAVSQAPRFLEAHQRLAECYRMQNNIPLWVKHRSLAQGGVDAER